MLALSAAASLTLIAFSTEVIAHGMARLPLPQSGPLPRRSAGFGRPPVPLRA